ncbi:heme-binding protein [Pseudomonas sp. NPDC090202]|uniref:GlcG/HbpS family heme-binding protein n=1 Tax=unclassified Pseudomonas TaxID=196821 RepID=UPI003803271B
MTRTYESITLQEARQMLDAAEAAAERIGLAYNVAVVDSGGHLVAFIRQDGALIGSIDLAIRKAKTARIFDKTTEYLCELAQPGAPLYGIDQTNSGNVVILGGGLPIVIGKHIVGAVGTSAGTVEQDIAVAQAAIDALNIKN